MSALRPPFTYYGGKTRLAERIAAALPQHRHYVEPFAGSLAVLLAKDPAPHETVNDLDGALVTFWRVLRDRPGDLERVCMLTPHARAEHAASFDLEGIDELETARRVWVMLSPGRGGVRRRTGWRHYQNPVGDVSVPGYLAGYLTRIRPAAARLMDVSLECRPALEVIAAYGRQPDVCIYADPPYLGTTRDSRGYAHEMAKMSEHAELLEALAACQASVVLSGYASRLYDDALADWSRIEIEAFTGQSPKAAASNIGRTEVLWINRPVEAADLFTEVVQ